MPFDAAGNQTTTDTDLSGASAITGNTVTTATGDATYRSNYFSSNGIIVQGDLTFSTYEDTVIGNSGTNTEFIDIQNGGILTIEGSGTAIVHTKEANNFNGSNAILVRDGGSLITNDCAILIASNCDFAYDSASGAQIIMRGTTFKKITADETQVLRFDFTHIDSNTNTDIDIVLDSIGMLLTGYGNFTVIGIKNGGSIDSNHTLQTTQSTYGIGNNDIFLQNISFADNAGFYSLKLRNDNTMTVRGLDVPLDQVGITGRLGIGGSDQGAVFFERNLSFQVNDPSGAVEGAIIKITDKREVGDTFTTPVTYTFTSIADGSTNTETILLGLSNALTATNQAGYENFESYGNDDDMDVRMTAIGFKYGYDIFSSEIRLIGFNELIYNLPLLNADSKIIESDKAVVDAYPFSITSYSNVGGLITATVTGDASTLQSVTTNQLYDLFSVYTEGTFDETDKRISKEGSTALLGNMILNLDYVTYQDSLETDQTINLLNGSTVLGGYSDSSGVVTIFNGFPTGTGLAIAVIEELDNSDQPLTTPVYYDLTADEGTGIASVQLEQGKHYRYKADASGYTRSNNDEWTYFIVDGATTIQIMLFEIVDSVGGSVYGQADPTRLSLISFDAISGECRFTNTTGAEITFTFYDAFDFLDDQITSHAAIQLGLRQFTFNIDEKLLISPAPALLSLNDDAANNARCNLDFIVIEAGQDTPRSMIGQPFNSVYGLEMAHTILTANVEGLATQTSLDAVRAIATDIQENTETL